MSDNSQGVIEQIIIERKLKLKDINIEELTQRAVEMGKKAANVDLDFSKESLKNVDVIIEQTKGLYDKHVVDEDVVWNVSVFMGLYCGEVFLKDALQEKDFSWEKNSDNIPVLKNKDGLSVIDPISKIYKSIRQLEQGEGNFGIESYYDTFLLMTNHNSV